MSTDPWFDGRTRLMPSGCIEWTGWRDRRGYGRARFDGVKRFAHRVAYALFVAPVPDGLVVMHSCDNPPCVNPAHLVLGTQADNLRDMTAKGRHGRYNATKTHCPKGHPYDAKNTLVRTTGHRMCRACDKLGKVRRAAARQAT